MSGQSSYSIATDFNPKIGGFSKWKSPEIKVGEVLFHLARLVWRCLKTFRFMLQPEGSDGCVLWKKTCLHGQPGGKRWVTDNMY